MKFKNWHNTWSVRLFLLNHRYSCNGLCRRETTNIKLRKMAFSGLGKNCPTDQSQSKIMATSQFVRKSRFQPLPRTATHGKLRDPFRNWNPYFYSASGRSPESLEFPIRANHLIRVNRANRFARITPLRLQLTQQNKLFLYIFRVPVP